MYRITTRKISFYKLISSPRLHFCVDIFKQLNSRHLSEAEFFKLKFFVFFKLVNKDLISLLIIGS